MKPALFPLMRIGILAFGYLYATSEITNAQVTPDNTVNTQVNQTDNVSEITGGETRGTNLFHSFQEFSVRTGNQAFFNNANAIKNIFSRVTGGNVSNIDGLIRANGSASLFLINPAGIIFGEGARLDIGGSFYGSSADSILFEDGEFSATDLDNPPVLTINAPIGLGFRDNPEDIANSSVANDGNGLEVATGNNITLLGGNISFSETFEGAEGNAGGIDLTTTNLTLANEGEIIASTNGIGIGGNIKITANDTLSINNGNILSVVAEKGEGNAGGIEINTNDLNINNRGAISTGIQGRGNGGKIEIIATDNIAVNKGFIGSAISSTAIGNSGEIEIKTPNLFFSNGAVLNTQSIGQGNAGNINVSADSITLDKNSSILASNTPVADFQANLAGGNIDLNIDDRLILRDDSTISAEAASNASGGNIDIDAGFVIAFPGSNNDIIASAEQGKGGNINITAESVFGIEERPLNDLTNDINASSESSLDGTVSITILEPDPIRGTAQLPINVIEPQQTTEQTCSVNQETGKANGLTVKGKGGVPPAPDLPLDSQAIMFNGQDVTTQTNQAQYPEIKPIPTSKGDIIPAQGVVVTKDGRVILTAYRTDSNSRVPQASANCGK